MNAILTVLRKSETKPIAAGCSSASEHQKKNLKLTSQRKLRTTFQRKFLKTKKFVSASVANDWTFALVENQESPLLTLILILLIHKFVELTTTEFSFSKDRAI